MVDEYARDVLAFASEMRNLSRTAALVDAISDMHASGKWRSYETALGREKWLECEFDYFLIACEATHHDISRVLAWNRQGQELASAMTAEDATKRRPIEQASAAWHSPTGETLVDRAVRQGWTNSRGTLRPPPVPVRARTKLRHGLTMDEHARQKREESIPATRRSELKRRVEDLAGELSDLELRYVRDVLAAKLAKANRSPEK